MSASEPEKARSLMASGECLSCAGFAHDIIKIDFPSKRGCRERCPLSVLREKCFDTNILHDIDMIFTERC